MKQKIKKLFEKHGDKIHSVQDAFKYLGQTFLTDFNIDIGTKTESKLVEMISERLHRPFRAAVERVFSRLKSINQFEKPQSRNPSYVKKTIWWCLIGQLIQALTAHNKGIPGSMRKRTMLV
jgi:iron-sulfur cluster repair protein YtfE (RIC family)